MNAEFIFKRLLMLFRRKKRIHLYEYIFAYACKRIAIKISMNDQMHKPVTEKKTVRQ